MKPTLYDLSLTRFMKMRLAMGWDKPIPFILDLKTMAAAAWLAADHPDKLFDFLVLPYKDTWLEFEFRDFRIGAILSAKEHLIGCSVIEYDDEQKIVYNPVTFLISPDRHYKLSSGYIQTPDNHAQSIRHVDAAVDRRWKEWAFTIPPGGRNPATPMPKWAPHACVALFDRGDAKMDFNIADTYLRSRRSVLLLILAGLAILSYGSAQRTVMAPSGRWVDRKNHSTRPYAVHTVVTVETSPKLIYKSMRNALTLIKRRQHDVRSHPRVIRRGRPDEYTVVVQSHKRGDPAIGVVVHDAYESAWIDRRKDMLDDR